jgi:sigma-B regulation protein RsbU (phosphoserine phosphatase)
MSSLIGQATRADAEPLTGTIRRFRILVCAGEPTVAEELRRPLAEAGLTVSQYAGDTLPTDWRSHHLIVVADAGDPETLALCRRLRVELGEHFVPLVLVTSGYGPGGRFAGFEAGMDACLRRPLAPGELLGQVQALLRIKERHDRLQEKAAEMQHTNKRLQQAHQRVDQELELARRIQQSFLPKTLPEVPGVRFAVHYRPCGRVGGDFYDLFRLDEQHVGFYVADAMGHGVPASLLTMFLKKAVRSKEIFDNQYRLVPPQEVLQHLNHDLLEQRIVESSFITMVYGLFNSREGTLRFARAGHPHPVYVPREGPPQLLEVPGTLLGVFETSFAGRECRLQPGEKALFYTDGTDAISFEGHPAGTDSLLACVERHRSLPIGELVDRLTYDLFHQIDQPDDFTLLGLEVE